MILLLALTAMTLIAKPLQSGDFLYEVNPDLITATIIGYGGVDVHVVIPSSVDGKTVTGIGDDTFNHEPSLIGISIPGTVTTIGDRAFVSCVNLSSLVIPDSVTKIGSDAFENCKEIGSIDIIGNGLISIGNRAFENCDNLEIITLPQSISYIGTNAFKSCSSLTEVYFEGNAPAIGDAVFLYSEPTAYFKPENSGWVETFAGRPTVLWYPEIWTDHPTFGVHSNHFGFTIDYWESGLVVVEVCSNLTSNDWTPVETNTMAWGSGYFSDPNWSNYSNRYYRLSMP